MQNNRKNWHFFFCSLFIFCVTFNVRDCQLLEKSAKVPNSKEFREKVLEDVQPTNELVTYAIEYFASVFLKAAATDLIYQPNKRKKLGNKPNVCKIQL